MDFLPFKTPEECGIVQLLILTGIYGFVLYNAADLIGSGSELLLLVPSLASMVGSVVLPVLGAVPDGMMVMFSGLKANPQKEIAVGVGALAGSTIMLLTLPWFLAIYAGRVNIKHGKPNYINPKLDPENLFDWSDTGVEASSQIKSSAILMLLTSTSYFIVQVPALLFAEKPDQSIPQKSAIVSTFALIGWITTCVFFVLYLWLQIRTANKENRDQTVHESRINSVQVEAIRKGKITLRGVMYGLLDSEESQNAQTDVKPTASRMMLLSSREQNRIKMLIRPFFLYYDMDRDQTLQRVEFSKIMKDLNESLTSEEENNLFNSVDVDQSNSIDFDEFSELMLRYAKGEVGRPLMARSVVKMQKFMSNQDDHDHNQWEFEEDEEDEIPHDLLDLSPEEQQARIKVRALWMMGLGSVLVLIFSDPAVDVLNDIGVRTGISPFYISFVLAPLASNASELVAATNYGLKKTKKTITISMSTLLGAANMNNTFCLAIFYCLVYSKELAWTFTAETLSIILVEFWVGFFAIISTVHTMKKAGMVLAAYPISLLMVYILENVFGFD